MSKKPITKEQRIKRLLEAVAQSFDDYGDGVTHDVAITRTCEPQEIAWAIRWAVENIKEKDLASILEENSDLRGELTKVRKELEEVERRLRAALEALP